MGKIVLRAERDALLKDFLTKDCGISKRTVTRLKHTGGITRGGAVIRTIDRVCPGDEIVLELSREETLIPNGSLRAEVVFENGSIAVFDKPVNMPVHPSTGHRDDTLGNLFAFRYPGIAFRPINRLDRDTSGLCLTAKDPIAACALQKSLKKTYYAVVTGQMTGNGVIDAPIGREGDSIIKRRVCEGGKRAVTYYKTLESGVRYSLMEIELETGRTHQIRVHFAHIGHPLAGDEMYGGSREDIAFQALHCGRLDFDDPFTKEQISVTSPIRDDMRKIL